MWTIYGSKSKLRKNTLTLSLHERTSGTTVWPFFNCTVHTEEVRNLHIGVYRKTKHADQCSLFDSRYPVEHKLGVIRTLQHRSDRVPMPKRRSTKIKCNNVVIHRVWRFFKKHCISVFFKPSNSLRQKLFDLKDHTPKHKKSNALCAGWCSEECTDLYSRETKQPWHNTGGSSSQVRATAEI